MYIKLHPQNLQLWHLFEARSATEPPKAKLWHYKQTHLSSYWFMRMVLGAFSVHSGKPQPVFILDLLSVIFVFFVLRGELFGCAGHLPHSDWEGAEKMGIG